MPAPSASAMVTPWPTLKRSRLAPGRMSVAGIHHAELAVDAELRAGDLERQAEPVGLGPVVLGLVLDGEFEVNVGLVRGSVIRRAVAGRWLAGSAGHSMVAVVAVDRGGALGRRWRRGREPASRKSCRACACRDAAIRPARPGT